jgi:plasmid stabilization system protein ParE
MTFTVQVRPDVEEDALAGYAWYEAKAEGLGEEFLAALYAGIQNIQSNPRMYRNVYGSFRRSLLRRFPYALYFVIDDETHSIIIVGLFHCARDPEHVAKTLGNRDG